MRKLHLLNAEWREQWQMTQREADYRAYQGIIHQLISAGCKAEGLPEAGSLFRSLRKDDRDADAGRDPLADDGSQDDPDDSDPDDDVIFGQVAMCLHAG